MYRTPSDALLAEADAHLQAASRAMERPGAHPRNLAIMTAVFVAWALTASWRETWPAWTTLALAALVGIPLGIAAARYYRALADAPYRGKAHAGVWLKGWRAGFLGDRRRNPYPDFRTERGSITGSRGIRSAWEAGFDAGAQARADAACAAAAERAKGVEVTDA